MPCLRENLQESRAHRRALRQAARAVEAAVGREPLDRRGLTEASRRCEVRRMPTNSRCMSALLAVLAELSPEDRRAVAALLLRPGPHRRGAPGQGGRLTEIGHRVHHRYLNRAGARAVRGSSLWFSLAALGALLPYGVFSAPFLQAEGGNFPALWGQVTASPDRSFLPWMCWCQGWCSPYGS